MKTTTFTARHAAAAARLFAEMAADTQEAIEFMEQEENVIYAGAIEAMEQLKGHYDFFATIMQQDAEYESAAGRTKLGKPLLNEQQIESLRFAIRAMKVEAMREIAAAENLAPDDAILAAVEFADKMQVILYLERVESACAASASFKKSVSRQMTN